MAFVDLYIDEPLYTGQRPILCGALPEYKLYLIAIKGTELGCSGIETKPFLSPL